MTYWRMTGGARKHPDITADEDVIQASYGLSAGFVRKANRLADPSPHDGISTDVWNADMGEAEGLAEPIKTTGVLALTTKRLIFFDKRFAIGRPKKILATWPLEQITGITYSKPDTTLMVEFTDGSASGLHVPSSQSPGKMIDGFAQLTRDRA